MGNISITPPLCIVEIVDVLLVKYKDVNQVFALKEGCNSLSIWRTIHKKYYSEVAKSINSIFSEDDLLVSEEFRLIHK